MFTKSLQALKADLIVVSTQTEDMGKYYFCLFVCFVFLVILKRLFYKSIRYICPDGTAAKLCSRVYLLMWMFKVVFICEFLTLVLYESLIRTMFF